MNYSFKLTVINCYIMW